MLLFFLVSEEEESRDGESEMENGLLILLEDDVWITPVAACWREHVQQGGPPCEEVLRNGF